MHETKNTKHQFNGYHVYTRSLKGNLEELEDL